MIEEKTLNLLKTLDLIRVKPVDQHLTVARDGERVTYTRISLLDRCAVGASLADDAPAHGLRHLNPAQLPTTAEIVRVSTSHDFDDFTPTTCARVDAKSLVYALSVGASAANPANSWRFALDHAKVKLQWGELQVESSDARMSVATVLPVEELCEPPIVRDGILVTKAAMAVAVNFLKPRIKEKVEIGVTENKFWIVAGDAFFFAHTIRAPFPNLFALSNRIGGRDPVQISVTRVKEDAQASQRSSVAFVMPEGRLVEVANAAATDPHFVPYYLARALHLLKGIKTASIEFPEPATTPYGIFRAHKGNITVTVMLATARRD